MSRSTAVKYRVGITGGVLVTVVDIWDYLDFTRNEHEEVKPERAALMHATRLLGSAHR